MKCIRVSAIVSLGLFTLASLGIGGCASGPTDADPAARQRAQDQWSSKEQSTIAAMPPRPDVDLGPAFDISVSESDLQTSARAILTEAVDSTNALLRMNAIEGLKYAPDLAPMAVRKGLGDENYAVRFVAAMIAGELRMTDMRPLIEPLLLDESESVQAAAIYASRRCGGTPPLTPLARMLLSEDLEVRGNAALVLGELGDRSALSLLRYAMGRGLLTAASARRKMVELQVAEAMVKLGDTQQIEIVRAALFSRPEDGEITALACQICGEVRDEGSLPNLLDMATRTGRAAQSAEIRMAAALAVAKINKQQAVLGVPEAYAGNPRFELRAQAALTLGGSGQKAAIPVLYRLMQDRNPLVQVCASAAVLEIGS